MYRNFADIDFYEIGKNNLFETCYSELEYYREWVMRNPITNNEIDKWINLDRSPILHHSANQRRIIWHKFNKYILGLYNTTDKDIICKIGRDLNTLGGMGLMRLVYYSLNEFYRIQTNLSTILLHSEIIEYYWHGGDGLG
jgi:hypothetical protein